MNHWLALFIGFVLGIFLAPMVKRVIGIGPG
jgi:hypothetical protein